MFDVVIDDIDQGLISKIFTNKYEFQLMFMTFQRFTFIRSDIIMILDERFEIFTFFDRETVQ